MNQADFDVVFEDKVTVVTANWLNGANNTLNAIANVVNFGAKGNGTADDSLAIQTAIDTGCAVFFPAGVYLVTKTLNLNTKGQILFGNGRFVSLILVNDTFDIPGNPLGVFVSASMEEGPQFRDFGISFIQPDTAIRAALINYPAALCLVHTPRFTVSNMRIACAMTGINMTGNSGGAFIDCLEISAFNVHLDMDGSLDTIRLNRVHVWNFGPGGGGSTVMTPNQQIIYMDGGTTGLRVGRVDDLIVSDSIFLCNGPEIDGLVGGDGLGFFGYFVGCVFDTFAHVNFALGDLAFVSCFFSQADTFFGTSTSNIPMIHQTGGNIRIVGCSFNCFTLDHTSTPLVFLDTNVNFPTFPSLTVDSCTFRLATNMTCISAHYTGVGEGYLHVMNNNFETIPNDSPIVPIIDVKTGIRATIIGNTPIDKGTGTGDFIRVAEDEQHIITGNNLIGWGLNVPTSQIFGNYSGNSGTGNDVQSHNLIGIPRTLVFRGTLDGAGAATIAHGMIAGFQNMILIFQGLNFNATDWVPITMKVNATNILLTGGTAGAVYRASIYWSTSQT